MSHTFITTKSLEQSVGTMETSAPLHDTRSSCLLDTGFEPVIRLIDVRITHKS